MPAELAHLVARLGRRLGAGRWRRHGRSGFGVRFSWHVENFAMAAAALQRQSAVSHWLQSVKEVARQKKECRLDLGFF